MCGPQYQRQRLSLKVREPRNLLSQNKNLSMHCIYIFILIICFLYFKIILILDKQKVIKIYSILFFLINKSNLIYIAQIKTTVVDHCADQKDKG